MTDATNPTTPAPANLFPAGTNFYKPDDIHRVTVSIYLITNKVNGKLYVGQTRGTVRRRLVEHVSAARCGGKRILSKAIRKYGRESFTIELLDICCSLAEADREEQSWIRHLNCSAPHGYNLSLGGVGSIIVSEDTRRKLSERVYTQATRDKLSASRRGVPLSDEAKNKLRDYWTGSCRPELSRPAERNPNSIMTWDKVRRVRSLVVNFSQRQLARRFGVSQTTINRVIRKIRWKDA